MCELIISVIDKGDELHWVKRGTVIETVEDDHDYGAEELTNPMFRIIKLPGVPMSFGKSFMGGELGDPRFRHQQFHRQFKIDLDHPSIPLALRAHLDDDDRTETSHTVDLDTFSLDALSALKTKRVRSDPTVIGEPSNVIG